MGHWLLALLAQLGTVSRLVQQVPQLVEQTAYLPPITSISRRVEGGKEPRLDLGVVGRF